VSPPTQQDIVTALAGLSGTPAPDISHQGPVGIATAKVHLTSQAIDAGATWRQVADILGHGNPAKAKRDHHRLESELRRELTLRQNAN
jgi:hypothetical protein